MVAGESVVGFFALGATTGAAGLRDAGGADMVGGREGAKQAAGREDGEGACTTALVSSTNTKTVGVCALAPAGLAAAHCAVAGV